MKKFRKIKAGHKSFGKKKVGDFIEVEHYIGLFDSITHAKQYSFAKEDSSYLENGYYEQKQISFDINRIGELEVVTRDGRKVLDIAALKTKTDYPVIAIVEGNESQTFSINGANRIRYDNPRDLFMLEYVPIVEEKEYEIDIYRVMHGFSTIMRPIDTPADTKNP